MEYVANRQIVSKTGQACEGTDRPTQRISDRAFHKGEVAAGGGMGSPEWRGSMAVLRFLVGIAPTGGVFPFLQKVSKGSASAKTADAVCVGISGRDAGHGGFHPGQETAQSGLFWKHSKIFALFMERILP